MTPKQILFVQQYLIDQNATQAAIRAGYSEKTAYSIGQRLLKNVEIEKALHEANEERAERTEVTQDYVLNNLTEVLERCLQRAPVVDRKGKQITDDDGKHVWMFNATGANKSLELLGRHLGMFKDKVELSGEVGLGARLSIALERANRDD